MMNNNTLRIVYVPVYELANLRIYVARKQVQKGLCLLGFFFCGVDCSDQPPLGSCLCRIPTSILCSFRLPSRSLSKFQLEKTCLISGEGPSGFFTCLFMIDMPTKFDVNYWN